MQNPLVRKLSVAAQLTPDDVSVIERLDTRAFRLSRRSDVIEEGDRPEDVHLVVEGFACRYKVIENGRRQILALLLPGDLCDVHVSLLKEMDHSIATLSDCTIARISRPVIDELIEHHPRIARSLWWSTLVDEGILRENIAGLGQRETIRQMAHLFCEMYRRMDVVGLVEDGAFDFPLTQEELGDMLGVSSVHTNHTVTDLRERDLAHFVRGRVSVPDFDRLAAFAGFRENYLHLSGLDRTYDRPRDLGAEIRVAAPAIAGPDLGPKRGFARSSDERPAQVPHSMFAPNLVELSGRRVLVVEDDYSIAVELGDAVSRVGGSVVGPAAGVGDALEILDRGEEVDAAILDINLGGAQVYPVARALRERSIPIVFVTGYDDWMIPQEYEDVPIFRKPTDPENVIRALFRR